MSVTRFFCTLATLISLNGCATIGDVAQTIADKAKGSSAETGAASTSPTASVAASSPPRSQPKSQPAQRTADADTIPDSSDNFKFGGYEWLILSRSAAGIRLQSTGWAGDQVATNLASLHCKKHGRIAQQAGEPKLALVIYAVYNFNCVK